MTTTRPSSVLTYPFLVLLLLTVALSGCVTFQLVPAGGKLVAAVDGTSARLRIYTLPPPQTPVIEGTLVVYVELHNRSQRSLRVSYPDLWMGDGRVRRVSALLPGEVLRPGKIPGGHRRLLASLGESVFFGRQSVPTRRLPEVAADVPGSALDLLTPTTRSSPTRLWIMRNDYGRGTQLTTDGWPYFGLPRAGTALSLWDILVNTLPDGAILPGGTAQGILFFPRDMELYADRGLHWDVHDALLDHTVETLSVALQVQ